MATAAKTRDARRRTGAGKGQAERGGQVQSLVRALAILNVLAEADDGASLTDIAQQVGIPVSTAHRLLTTLQQERYVRFDAERTLWSIGMQAFVVGNGFVRTRNLIQIARPHMRQLMLDSGETVNLGVEDRGEAIYLAQIECRQMMRALAAPGERVPLHCSGIGKALLAAMPESKRSSILQKHGMQRYTDMTIITPATLRDELARTGVAATRLTTRSMRSACAAPHRSSSTKPRKRSRPSRCPAPRPGYPTTALPCSAIWSAASPPPSPPNTAAVRVRLRPPERHPHRIPAGALIWSGCAIEE